MLEFWIRLPNDDQLESHVSVASGATDVQCDLERIPFKCVDPWVLYCSA